MYLVPFSAHPGHSRLTQVGYIRRCQAPTLRNRSRGGEATRLKNQGPGFEPGPRCYFSCSAETSESHASYITPRRALLRTKTLAPPPLTLSAGATIHILSAASLGATEGGWHLVPFSDHSGLAQLTQVGHIRRCQAPTVSTKRGARRVKDQGSHRELFRYLWWRRWDSNPRPPHCECGALPTEL